MSAYVRNIIAILSVACASWFPSCTLAEAWPSKPIRLIVPATPGGVTDILARSISQHLSGPLGQAVVPDYRPGANMVVGADLAAKSPADGYTFFLGASPSHTFNPLLRPNLPYDAVKDFEPVIILVTVPYLFAANASLPVKSVEELIKYARSRPGKLSYGSWGSGSIANVGMELLKLRAGIDLVHIPYKGTAAAETDLVAGRIDVMITTFTVLPQVKAGKVRALATTALRRSALTPDVPTVAESGDADFDVKGWYGVFAPAGTPLEVVRKLNAEVNKVLQKPDVIERLRNLALEPAGGTTDRLVELMRSEHKKWDRVIREANIKLD